MDEITTDTRNYELTLHLRPELAGAELKQNLEAIEKKIQDFGGEVLKRSEINKQKLAYRIKKAQSSFIAWLNFGAPTEAITNLNQELLLNGAVMRHAVKILHEEKLQPIKTRVIPIKQKPIPRVIEEKVEVKQEELDKKLEEILENI